MAHAPMPWVKLHTNRLDDVRFNRLPDPLKWRWTQLTMLAGRLDAGGTFVLDGVPLTDEELAWQLRLDLDAWKQDSELLKDCGYLVRNGHGWQLTDFMDAQGPAEIHAEKREQWRIRQERHRSKASVTSDTPVSHAPKSQSQESEKSQSQESEKSQSVLTREALNMSGVPAKFHDRLTDHSSTDLTLDDFLAELARNYARQGSGKGEVKNPPLITAMNLLKGEHPADNWYSLENWKAFIPTRLLQHVRPDLFTEDMETDDIVLSSGYTNLWIPEETSVPDQVAAAWAHYMDAYEKSLDPGKNARRGNFVTWIKDTQPLHYANGKLILAARNSYAEDWLNSHNFSDEALEALRPSIPDLSEVVITRKTEDA